MQDNNEANGHQLLGGFAALTAIFAVLVYLCF